MVFNRHLKALNLCNHSDTIACVLYELLVNLELINVGFQTHDQGSTSFSFVQFSRSCSLPRLNVPTEFFKLVSALIVAVAIAAPSAKKMLKLKGQKRKARKNRLALANGIGEENSTAANEKED